MAFFQDSRPSREPFLNVPSPVAWLIGIILALHFARVAMPPALAERILSDWAFVPARYAASLSAPALDDVFRQMVTFVTYMFLHGDFTHVGINSLWLLAFGPPVARRLGPQNFLLLFFLCEIAAASLHLVTHWGDAMEVVGASGGISGLMAGSVRILYAERGLAPGAQPPLAPILSRPVVLFSAIWLVMNMLAGYTGLGATEDFAAVAWVAHLGGYLAGMVAIGWFDAPPVRAV